LRRSILHKRRNDDGDSDRIRRCQSLSMSEWAWPMTVSRSRLRSEKNARCPLRCIPEALAGSLGLAHRPHRNPCYVRSFRRALFSGVIIRGLSLLIVRSLGDSCCLILNDLEKNYCQAGKPGDSPAPTHGDKVGISTVRREAPVLLRISPHGHTGRCHGLARGAPLEAPATFHETTNPNSLSIIRLRKRNASQ